MSHLSRVLLLTPTLCIFLSKAPILCLAADYSVHCESWPEADQLFKQDSRWRGADAANSIDLGGGRILWTFGDAFVDINEDPSLRHRRTAKFIRNSIAIQKGYDPTTATFQPYWQEDEAGKPSSFFRSEGDVFYWPGGGLVLDDKLLVYLMRIRNSDAKLGFSVVGWGAVLVDNPQEDPSNWHMTFIATPQNSLRVIVGSGSSLRRENWIYSFGSDRTTSHGLYLTRLPVADALAADFSTLQWWNEAEDSWTNQDEIDVLSLKPTLDDGQTEFTVHYEPIIESFLLTQFTSFPRSPIAVRNAQKLTGPWSLPRNVFTPEEADPTRKGTMTYAAKVHPEQAADGLAVTYCTNASNPGIVVEDESLYYPRFLRFVIESIKTTPEQ